MFIFISASTCEDMIENQSGNIPGTNGEIKWKFKIPDIRYSVFSDWPLDEKDCLLVMLRLIL